MENPCYNELIEQFTNAHVYFIELKLEKWLHCICHENRKHYIKLHHYPIRLREFGLGFCLEFFLLVLITPMNECTPDE